MTRADLRATAAALDVEARDHLEHAYSYPRGPMRDLNMHRCWAASARAAAAYETARGQHDKAEAAMARARQHETWAEQMEGAMRINASARGEVLATVRP